MKLNKMIENLKINNKEEDIVIVKEHICPTCKESWIETCHLDDSPAIDYFIEDWDTQDYDINVCNDYIDIVIKSGDKECHQCANSCFMPADSFIADYDEEWEQVCFHHGLAAFCKEENLIDNIDRIYQLNEHMQICCSTEQIGPFGITCSGRVLLASNADMWSVIDEDSFNRLID